MEMFFLIISLSGHPVVMPEKYDKEQCEKLRTLYGGTLSGSACIPAPSFPLVTFIDPKHCKPQPETNTLTCEMNGDTLTQLDKRYPGYTCGSRDSECRLLKVE